MSPLESPPLNRSRRRRAAWRQRIVEAERGIACGFRGDSVFFVHFFMSSIVVAAAAVLGFDLLRWAILTLSLTVVLAAELFHQVVKLLLQLPGVAGRAEGPKAVTLSTAATMLSIAGAVITLGLLFTQRVLELTSN